MMVALQKGQMVDRDEFLAHPAGQAMQHVSQSDRRERRETKLDRREQIDSVKLWLEAGEPATEGSSAPEGEPDVGRIVEIGQKYGLEMPSPPGQ